LVAVEHGWAHAIVENDVDKLERIVGQEYTLAANNFPGRRTRLSRQEWMATVPIYEVWRRHLLSTATMKSSPMGSPTCCSRLPCHRITQSMDFAKFTFITCITPPQYGE
jgi:hypothetical protein